MSCFFFWLKDQEYPERIPQESQHNTRLGLPSPLNAITLSPGCHYMLSYQNQTK